MAGVSGICSVPGMARVWSGKTPHKAALIDFSRGLSRMPSSTNDPTASRIRWIATRYSAWIPRWLPGHELPAFFEVWVGANKAGCALAPLNWRSAPAELVEVVQDARMPLIVAGRDFTELAERVGRATGTERGGHSRRRVRAVVFGWRVCRPGHCGSRQCDRLVGLYVGYHRHAQGRADFARRLDEVVRCSATTEPSVNWNGDDIGLMLMPNFHLGGT